jgi:RNA polymerase sigma-70 factor (ECF subfamily)
MPSQPSARFTATRWTLVQQADGDTPAARAALGELCDIYYAPVVAFIRRWRHDSDEDAAREQAHAFFEAVLSKQAIGAPDPERGRFRNYLLGAVKHFLAHERRAAAAEKRGGGVVHETPEDIENPPADESQFDRAWALALIGRALTDLETEMRAAGKGLQFESLKPWLDGKASTSQAEAANTLGLTENAIKVAIHRLRERFRAKVRAEVIATLHDPAEIDAELRHLVAALAS